MSEPIVGCRSIISALNISIDAPGTLPGFPVASLANGLTFDRARFNPAASPREIYIDAGSAVACDYIGVASHNMGEGASGFSLYGNTVPGMTGSPTLCAIKSFADGDSPAPFLLPFDAQTFRYWTVRFGRSLFGAPFDIGALYLGERITFERCLMRSHAPAQLNRMTDFYDNASDTGQFLGRSIIRRGFRTDVSVEMMTAPWARTQFQSFVRAARLSPYFFAWNPSLYPDDVVFGRTREDIGTDYTGDRNRMRANWKIEGLGYDD